MGNSSTKTAVEVLNPNENIESVDENVAGMPETAQGGDHISYTHTYTSIRFDSSPLHVRCFYACSFLPSTTSIRAGKEEEETH